jgi:subtilisin family serine protease
MSRVDIRSGGPVALPTRIFAQAWPHSIGGRSLFGAKPRELRGSSLLGFTPDASMRNAAAFRLLQAGFDVLHVSPVSINIAGPPEAFERAFRTKIVEREVPQVRGPSSTFLDSPDTELLGLVSSKGTPLGSVIDGLALEVPRRFMQASATPPTVDYVHLDVPAGVARASNATPLHGLLVNGHAVKVAMVDSGFYRHPFFAANGYSVAPVVLGPGASAPESDESGHGTGESANIFAIAPGCTLFPVKASFVNTIGAFNAAVALGPDIITCSWGSHVPFALGAADLVLAASVSAAVASGITVIFSAGNGHAGFPGQHPDVISAGGAFVDVDGSVVASDYSSGFQSNVYPGRRVPDLCGLVGQRPKAIYIMLPVEPGDSIDAGNSGGVFPDGDQTAPDDGWAAFSGTSAAAPQLAGVAALIKQVSPSASPGDIKAAMMSTARDVGEGMCNAVPDIHDGLPAVPDVPDDATGNGLVDAASAVVCAYWMSLLGMTGLQAGTDAVDAYYAGLVGAWSSTDPVVAAYCQGMADAAAASAA